MKRSCAEAEAFEKCAKRDPVDDPEEHVEAMGSTLQSKMNHVVTLITNKWGKIPRLSPDKFYSKLLLSRGYGVDVIKPAVYVSVKDELDCAVSDEFVSKLASIRVASGTDSKLKVPSCPLERVLENPRLGVAKGGNTIMHVICSSELTNFEAVHALLVRDQSLLHVTNFRGETPLSLVRPERWMAWAVFLYQHRDSFWPVLA